MSALPDECFADCCQIKIPFALTPCIAVRRDVQSWVASRMLVWRTKAQLLLEERLTSVYAGATHVCV